MSFLKLKVLIFLSLQGNKIFFWKLIKKTLFQPIFNFDLYSLITCQKISLLAYHSIHKEKFYLLDQKIKSSYPFLITRGKIVSCITLNFEREIQNHEGFFWLSEGWHPCGHYQCIFNDTIEQPRGNLISGWRKFLLEKFLQKNILNKIAGIFFSSRFGNQCFEWYAICSDKSEKNSLKNYLSENLNIQCLITSLILRL